MCSGLAVDLGCGAVIATTLGEASTGCNESGAHRELRGCRSVLVKPALATTSAVITTCTWLAVEPLGAGHNVHCV